MWDATGKHIDGILNLQLQTLGSFQSCYDLQTEVTLEDGLSEFGGKYCLTQVFSSDNDPNGASTKIMKPNGDSKLLSIAFRQGICFPDTCSDQDVAFWMMDSMETSSSVFSPYFYGCQSKVDEYEVDVWFYILG